MYVYIICLIFINNCIINRQIKNIILLSVTVQSMSAVPIATVNINMGYETNPTLTITQQTNIEELVTQFIKTYELPYTAYQLIINTIMQELQRCNVDIMKIGKNQYKDNRGSRDCREIRDERDGRNERIEEIKDVDRHRESDNDRVEVEDIVNEGRKSFGKNFRKIGKKQTVKNVQNQWSETMMRQDDLNRNHHRVIPDKQNTVYYEHKNKKQPISWDKIKQKKQFPINRIEFPKKCPSPMLHTRQPQPKPTKITLLRTKSPSQQQKYSPNQPRSPTPTRTPYRQPLQCSQPRQNRPPTQPSSQSSSSQYVRLSQIFDWLTRNQPKTMKILNPQYVSFNGIKPEILAVLQQFFEVVQQNEFSNMDKMYFIRRIRMLGLNGKLTHAMG